MKRVIILLLFLSCLVVGGILAITKDSERIERVRIAYAIDGLAPADLDPASIEILQQALLIDNIYSHLVEYDDEGQLQPGIAKTFYWKGLELILEFSDKAITKSGHVVDAEDAAFSIYRVLKLGKSTHSNLIRFLCGSKVEINKERVCDAVAVIDNKLVIKVSEEKYKPFVLQSLAADDLVIVPKMAIDAKTLKIIDYTETSGPYYIDSADSSEWVLRQNTKNYCIMKSSPESVVLVSTAQMAPADLFINNQVDVISTLNNIGKAKFKEVEERVPGLRLSKTMDIKLYYFQFSPKAVSKFTFRQRAYLINKFRKLMEVEYPLPIGSSPVNRFFLDQATGMLSDHQINTVNKYLEIENAEEFSQKVSFYFYTNLKKIFEVFKTIDEISPIDSDELPFSQKVEDRLDLFMATTDTSYGENLALLNYNFTQGTFGVDKESGAEWLEQYISLATLEERAQLVQQLHFRALTSGVLFPVFKAPYTSLSRNGFSFVLSPLFASSHFWKIEKK